MSQIQFNLLPLSKMQAISSRDNQEQLTKKILQATIICTVLFIALFFYTSFVQKTQINSSKSLIETKAKALEQTPNINTILTVQNQLQTAASLHARQHDASRIFDYLAKLTPLNASVNNINLDLLATTVKIDGSADSATTVNAFIDSLKLAQFKLGSSTSSINAFSSVVEASFAISQNGVSFSLNAKFDPRLFTNQSQAPVLNVPNSTTVHSNDPGSLFGGNL